MEKQEILFEQLKACERRIIMLSRKVVNYPKGSDGYNPIDLANLTYEVKRLEKLETRIGI